MTDLDQKIARADIFDDIWFRIFFYNARDLVEYILRVTTGVSGLVVDRYETEYDTPALASRSVRLDVWATDERGDVYNIEFQRDDRGASPKRARYHASALDASSLPKGADFEALPRSYVIFFTRRDYFGMGRTAYRVERMIEGTTRPFGDESRIIYLNCATEDRETELGRLANDLTRASAEEMLTPMMAERTRFFKQSKEGRRIMNTIFADELEAAERQGRAEGMAKGMAKGRAEGIAKGRAEGRAEGRIEILERLKAMLADGSRRDLSDAELIERLSADLSV